MKEGGWRKGDGGRGNERNEGINVMGGVRLGYKGSMSRLRRTSLCYHSPRLSLATYGHFDHIAGLLPFAV